jgi:hypothetical protein
MGYRIPQTVYEVYEPGVYVARLAAAEVIDGQYGQQLKVKFELDGEHLLTVWTSLTFTQKSRLGQLAKAAFGRDIPPDYELDTDHLIGRRLRLLVTVEERSDGSTYNKVSQFLPLQATPAARPPAPRPPAPSSFDDGGIFDGAPPIDEKVPF